MVWNAHRVLKNAGTCGWNGKVELRGSHSPTEATNNWEVTPLWKLHSSLHSCHDTHLLHHSGFFCDSGSQMTAPTLNLLGNPLPMEISLWMLFKVRKANWLAKPIQATPVIGGGPTYPLAVLGSHGHCWSNQPHDWKEGWVTFNWWQFKVARLWVEVSGRGGCGSKLASLVLLTWGSGGRNVVHWEPASMGFGN